MSGLMADKIVCRLCEHSIVMKIHRTHFPMKLKSPMSEPEKEQTWDFSIFMQVPAKALTAATTVPPGALRKKDRSASRSSAEPVFLYASSRYTQYSHLFALN